MMVIYTTPKVELPLASYESGLIDLFYTHIYPFYPIMDCGKEGSIQRRRNGQVGVPLMSCIYLDAVEF